jgi:tRNA1Val (adenine37-N6)-methyltransferase
LPAILRSFQRLQLQEQNGHKQEAKKNCNRNYKMPNSYFQFKQFAIHQDKTAMKVCTDACLFGAWVAKRISEVEKNKTVSNILDVGTGTGLLSMMLAQKTKAHIDAIEIDEAAAMQATENVMATPWKERIRVINADIKEHACTKQYDLILSNPPFYEKDLKSGDESKDRAMHDTSLTMQELIPIVKNNLASTGMFAVLLPHHRMDYLIEIALSHQLNLLHRLLVKPTVKHAFTRAILLFTNRNTGSHLPKPITEELTIKEVHHSYSLPFIDLLEDYYLSL